MVEELKGISEQVRRHAGQKAQNLASSINVEVLLAIHEEMDGKKAPGIDGVTKADYTLGIMPKIESLVTRMKHEAYKPQASRRTYIEKPGSNKKRPLGISCYEDKLVETAVAQLLEIVYEPIFKDCSYGFRPGRNCHQAIKKVINEIQSHKVNYVVEADIRSFFDMLDHEWLIKFLEHDIADRKFISIIQRQLKAGIMEDGKHLDSEAGTPQGGCASTILANVYLHYVLDLWFNAAVRKGQYRGEAYLTRYADDFVACFQYKEDAEKFYDTLGNRMAQFGLALAPEKTRILEFGRFAEQNRSNRGEGKPETFSFLGFTFYCSKDRTQSRFRVKVKSDRKKTASKLKKMNIWIKEHRHRFNVKEMINRINRTLQGYYNYYAVTDNLANVAAFRFHVVRLLFKWLNRRSQRKSYSWLEFNDLLTRLPIDTPKLKHCLYATTR
ncbi:MAG TPA: group II intron reverse transcriptase/maturase [Anaerovoracaceae bacterium]|nr:group II intron reverse transcriptase/maturase [Anaerovoracaceae bacterium]